MYTKNLKAMLCATAGVTFAAMASPCAAQTVAAHPVNEAQGVGEVVVTAQRRKENLQNVPISITAISSGRLEASAATNITDLQALSPSLQMNTSGGGQVLARIRGVGTTVANPTIENPVGVYVDDVYIQSTGAALLSLADVAQIDILKGPQGTLFGQNVTGGLIQITTLEPSHTPGGTIEGTIGNLDTYGGKLYVTGGLTENIAANLSLFYNNQQQGFGRNLYNGQWVNNFLEYGVRSKVRAETADGTVVTLIGDYEFNKGTLGAFRPINGSRPGNGTFPYNTPFPAPVISGWNVDSNVQPADETRQDGVSATVEHPFGNVVGTSITAFRTDVVSFALDSDKTAAPASASSLVGPEQSFSQEIRFSSKGQTRFKWTVGGVYFNYMGGFLPAHIVQGGGDLDINIRSHSRTSSIAGFAQGTFAVTDALNLTAGIRYTDESKNASGTQILTFSPPFTTVIQHRPPGTVVQTRTVSANSTSYDPVTYRLAADYRISPELMAYASYSVGSKSGGFNIGVIPLTPYRPETLDAAEVGFKSDLFDRRLRLDVSAYDYYYNNMQVSSIASGVLNILNAASAHIYGVEADADVVVNDNFSIDGGVSWIHDRFSSFRDATFYVPNPGAAGGNSTLTAQNATGHRLPNTPDWTLQVTPTYQTPIGANNLSVTATFAYNDGWYGDPSNRTRQPSYWLINGSANFTIAKKYSLIAWVKNLTNQQYDRQLSETATTDAYILAPGRTFGLTLRARF